MSRTIFSFVASFFLLLALFSGGLVLSPSTQLIVALSFILLLGIPHGAIDNVLFLRKSSLSNGRFIANYVLASAINVAVWFVLPAFAYVLFLLISAYHFGQSQFSHHVEKASFYDRMLFLSWGVVLMTGLIHLNASELASLTVDVSDLAVFHSVNTSPIIPWLMYGSVSLMLLLLFRKAGFGRLTIETILLELVILGLVLSAFYVFPFLIGFTLYFVILHSLKVMREEYDYLSSVHLVRTIFGFVKLLLPFSLLSLLGIGFLYALIALGWVNISSGFAMMVVISSITVPHVFVMERFYRIYAGKGDPSLR